MMKYKQVFLWRKKVKLLNIFPHKGKNLDRKVQLEKLGLRLEE